MTHAQKVRNIEISLEVLWRHSSSSARDWRRTYNKISGMRWAAESLGAPEEILEMLTAAEELADARWDGAISQGRAAP